MAQIAVQVDDDHRTERESEISTHREYGHAGDFSFPGEERGGLIPLRMEGGDAETAQDHEDQNGKIAGRDRKEREADPGCQGTEEEELGQFLLVRE